MSTRRKLQRKERRRTYFDLVLNDTTEAEADLETATGALRLARLRYDDPRHPDREKAQAEFAKARLALLEHVCRIWFEAIPMHEWEALLGEHPPTPKQMAVFNDECETAKRAGTDAPDAPQFDPVTLLPALFARCAIADPDDPDDTPLTETEWSAELAPDGRWQEAEKNAALDACLTAILRPRSVVIPKG
jgi:hypothetical protein